MELTNFKNIEQLENICKDLENSKDYITLLGVYNDLATLYEEKGNIEKSKNYYFKIIDILKEKDDINSKNDISNAYNNLAILLIKQEKYNEAEDLYLKSIEIKEEISKNKINEYKNALGIAYNNLGAFYYGVDEDKLAEEYYLKSLKILKKDKKTLLVIYENLINVYLNLNDYILVNKYCKKAIKLCKRMNVSSDAFYEILKKQEVNYEKD